jgi:Tol biopolymer transport system component
MFLRSLSGDLALDGASSQSATFSCAVKRHQAEAQFAAECGLLPCRTGRRKIGSPRSRKLPASQEMTMAEGSTTSAPPKNLERVRLDSWKEIAAYLNRDVATVQRWEKRESMPVHRHLHNKRGSVYALPKELDSWREGRKFPPFDEKNGVPAAVETPGEATERHRRRAWIFALPLLAAAIAAIGSFLWLEKTDHFWRNPIVDARFETVTDWGGLEQAAAISRDGQFIAFLSDRDGQMDVWVTQVGSGQFHNLTHGNAAELVNPSVRTLGFSPDGSLVTYWMRKPDPLHDSYISIWAVPTLGGEPRPYLEGAAEYDWSNDGQRLVYHTPVAGDPMYVSSGSALSVAGPIFTAPAGLHSHFPFWSPDQKSIYFVHGSLPDNLDIWRIAASGGNPERITKPHAQVTYPVLLDRRTLLYLSTDPDGFGPWLYGTDLAHRIPHRLIMGVDRYTSLAATADGRRLVVTQATPERSFWRLHIDASGANAATLSPITLSTTSGFRPRLGADYLLYVSASGESESIWKLANGGATELWRGRGAQIIGGPAISADGRSIAFSTLQNGRSLLYVMGVDGADPRIVTDSLDLQGEPAWEPGGEALITAALDHGAPRLFRAPLTGGSPALFSPELGLDPAWAPDGGFVLFSGPDVGATFSVKAAKPNGSAIALPPLTLTRGARHLAFLPGSRNLVVLRGEIQHKNLWLINLQTGAEQQLTDLPSDFDVRDFDVSPDGHEAVLERIQDRSEVVLVKLARR